MEPLIATNWLLQAQAAWLSTLFQSGDFYLRLFQNSPVLTPASTLGDLIECSFNGYMPWNLAGLAAPIKQQDGLYVIAETSPLFGCEAGSQTVNGVYISNGVDLAYVQFLPIPITVSPGSSFVIPLQIWFEALSIIVCQ